MKKTLLLLPFVFLLTLLASAQTSETKYYRRRTFDNEVTKEKARYSQTVTKENGVVTTTITNLKKGQIESRNAWRGDEPVGKWIGLTGSGPEEMDYDFDLIYGDSPCADPRPLQDVPDLGSKEEIMQFISRHLRYPARARLGIQGTIYLIFTVTAEGIVRDVAIRKGIDPVLDKEAARVVRALKFSPTTEGDGQPQDVCVEMPIRFLLN